jgi:amino acid transporter
LLLAYLATGASVAGGALYYATVLCQQFFHGAPPAIPTLAAVCLIAGFIAWRDVKLSAEIMLWIEAVSVSLIVIVLILLPVHLGLHIDTSQFRLQAIFSFAGFESATTLGGETREPLKTIPRAVLQCALLAGVFFMLCAYSEVVGFRGESTALSDSTSPLHLLSAKAGVSPLGVAIDCGAFISMFACVLACSTAAARVLLRMAHDGLLPAAFERTNRRHGTPGTAIVLSTALMFAATAGFALLQATGSTMYDLFGSLSVFGFLTAYALVAVALPFARRALGRHSHILAAVSVLTVVLIVLIAIFDLNSAADAVHARIPYLYLIYIGLGLAWYGVRRNLCANR